MNAPLSYFRRLFARWLGLAGLCASLSVFAQANPSLTTNLTAAVEPTAANEIPAAVSTETNAVTESISVATNATQEITSTNAAGLFSAGSKLQLNDSLSSPLASLGRVMLMLAVVLTIFIGGMWLFRNWQRFTVPGGQSPKLNVLESRSLGGRHAIYVIGYENERLLISSSPTGINLLTHLQPSDETAAKEKPITSTPTFAATLAQMLKGKKS